ncbi:MAG: hypothetical protein J5935_07305 [Lachnospiraceae bacterium]|nr:hypothetical protein [Lachnospiraceae bacterium]
MQISLLSYAIHSFIKRRAVLLCTALFLVLTGCAYSGNVLQPAGDTSPAADTQTTQDAQTEETEEPASAASAADTEPAKKAVPSSMKRLPLNREYTFGEEDAPRTLLLKEWADDSSAEVLLTIETEGSKAIADVGYTEFHPYLITLSPDYEYNETEETRYYLYLDAAGELGQRALFIYDLNGASLTETTQVPLGLYSGAGASLSPESFILENSCAFLTSYTIRKEYHVGKDGIPESDVEDFFFDTPEEYVVTAKKESLGGEVFRSARGVATKQRPVAEGEELVLYATDNATYIDLENIKNKRVYRFLIDSSKYPPQIGEESITSLFDGFVLTGQE